MTSVFFLILTFLSSLDPLSKNRFSARVTRSAYFRSSDYNLTEIDSTVGLYFEKYANLQICTKHATFVIHTNLTSFVNEEKYFEYTVSELQKFCQKISENSTNFNSNANCSNTIDILYASLEEIKEFSIQNHMVWFHHMKSPSVKHVDTSNNLKILHRRRKKRDLSNAFAKLVFGSSSSNDGNSAIQMNMLKLQTVENLLLIDKHKTVIDALLNVVNNTVQFQSDLHTKLQNSFDNLTEWFNHTANKTNVAIQSQELYAKFIELSFVVMFSILEFRENQRKLFDAISVKSTAFQLIPPKMFEMKLREVSESGSSDGGAHLPMPLTMKNLAKFYEITTIEREIVNETFVCRFSVPLVDATTFNLYKAISVPYRNDTQYNVVVPRYEFIALDASNSTYLTWTANDLKRCHRLNGTNLMCYLNTPINVAPNSVGCEINLLLGREFSKNCEFRRENSMDEFWVKLEQPNTYLYALPNIMPVVIQCPQSNTSIYLQNTGIISLKSGCRIKTSRIELITFHSIEANISSHHLMQPKSPKLNVSSQIPNATQINLAPVPIVALPNNSNFDDWIKVEEIKHNLQMEIGVAMEAAEKVLNSVVNSSQSNEILLSLAAIVVAIAVIYTCIKYSLTTGLCILLSVILVCIATSIVHYFI